MLVGLKFPRLYPARQALALIVSGALVVTSAPAARPDGMPAETFVAPSSLPQFYLQPPARLGRLTDYFRSDAPSAPLVVLIQDLHANYSVQKNIAGLLQFLSDRLPFKLAVEGASGPVDDSVLTQYPDNAVRDAATDYLLREAEISGADAFAVRRGLPRAITGVENPNFYQVNRDLFRQSLDGRTQLVAALDGIAADLATLPRSLYSRELKSFEMQQRDYHEGRISGEAWIAALLARPEARAIDLRTQYPALAHYAVEARALAPEQLHAKTVAFLTTINGRLSAEEKKNLRVLARSHERAPYYRYLRELVYQKQLFLAMPLELGQYLEYLHTSETSEMDRVLFDAQQLAYAIELRIAQGQGLPAGRQARDLVRVRHDVGLLRRVTDLDATEMEVRAFAPHLREFIALARTLVVTPVGPGQRPAGAIDAGRLRSLISASIDYYVMAMTRNAPMLDNTLALMRPASAPHAAVLIAGGFHTAPLTQLLRDKKINYIVLTPTVDSISDADRALYVKRLKGEYLTPADVYAAAQERAPNFAQALGQRQGMAARLARFWQEWTPRHSLAVARDRAFDTVARYTLSVFNHEMHGKRPAQPKGGPAEGTLNIAAGDYGPDFPTNEEIGAVIAHNVEPAAVNVDPEARLNYLDQQPRLDSFIDITHHPIHGGWVIAYNNPHIIRVPNLFVGSGGHQVAHVGLGRAFSQPVIYVDAEYVDDVSLRKDLDRILRFEMYKIYQWEMHRQVLNLALDPAPNLTPWRMREWIAEHPKESEALNQRWSSEANKMFPIGDILESARRRHHLAPAAVEALPSAALNGSGRTSQAASPATVHFSPADWSFKLLLAVHLYARNVKNKDLIQEILNIPGPIAPVRPDMARTMAKLLAGKQGSRRGRPYDWNSLIADVNRTAAAYFTAENVDAVIALAPRDERGAYGQIAHHIRDILDDTPNLAAGKPGKTVSHGWGNHAVYRGIAPGLRGDDIASRRAAADANGVKTVVEHLGEPPAPGAVNPRVIPVSNLLKRTGQIAHIGLGRTYGEPVVYIDANYLQYPALYPDALAVLRHEQSEIRFWEWIRLHWARTTPEGMHDWIRAQPRWLARLLAWVGHIQAPSVAKELMHARVIMYDHIVRIPDEAYAPDDEGPNLAAGGRSIAMLFSRNASDKDRHAAFAHGSETHKFSAAETLRHLSARFGVVSHSYQNANRSVHNLEQGLSHRADFQAALPSAPATTAARIVQRAFERIRDANVRIFPHEFSVKSDDEFLIGDAQGNDIFISDDFFQSSDVSDLGSEAVFYLALQAAVRESVFPEQYDGAFQDVLALVAPLVFDPVRFQERMQSYVATMVPADETTYVLPANEQGRWPSPLQTAFTAPTALSATEVNALEALTRSWEKTSDNVGLDAARYELDEQLAQRLPGFSYLDHGETGLVFRRGQTVFKVTRYLRAYTEDQRHALNTYTVRTMRYLRRRYGDIVPDAKDVAPGIMAMPFIDFSGLTPLIALKTGLKAQNKAQHQMRFLLQDAEAHLPENLRGRVVLDSQQPANFGLDPHGNVILWIDPVEHVDAGAMQAPSSIFEEASEGAGALFSSFDADMLGSLDPHRQVYVTVSDMNAGKKESSMSVHDLAALIMRDRNTLNSIHIRGVEPRTVHPAPADNLKLSGAIRKTADPSAVETYWMRLASGETVSFLGNLDMVSVAAASPHVISVDFREYENVALRAYNAVPERERGPDYDWQGALAAQLPPSAVVDSRATDIARMAVQHGTLRSFEQSVRRGPKNVGKGFGGRGLYVSVSGEEATARYFAEKAAANAPSHLAHTQEAADNTVEGDQPVILQGTIKNDKPYRVGVFAIGQAGTHLSKGILDFNWDKNPNLRRFMESQFDILDLRGLRSAGLAIGSDRMFVVHERAGSDVIAWDAQEVPFTEKNALYALKGDRDAARREQELRAAALKQREDDSAFVDQQYAAFQNYKQVSRPLSRALADRPGSESLYDEFLAFSRALSFDGNNRYDWTFERIRDNQSRFESMWSALREGLNALPDDVAKGRAEYLDFVETLLLERAEYLRQRETPPASSAPTAGGMMVRAWWWLPFSGLETARLFWLLHQNAAGWHFNPVVLAAVTLLTFIAMHLPQYLVKKNGERTSVMETKPFWLVAGVEVLAILLAPLVHPFAATLILAGAIVFHYTINVRVFRLANPWVDRHYFARKRGLGFLAKLPGGKAVVTPDDVADAAPLAEATAALGPRKLVDVQAAFERASRDAFRIAA